MACAFGSCQSWPRRHKADGGQVSILELVPAEAFLIRLPSGSSRRRPSVYSRTCPGGGIPDSPTVGLVPAEA